MAAEGGKADGDYYFGLGLEIYKKSTYRVAGALVLKEAVQPLNLRHRGFEV